MLRAALLACLAAPAAACSNFYMKYSNPDFRISARTEDMVDFVPDMIHVYPRGRVARPPSSKVWEAKYGFVGFGGAYDPFVHDPIDNVYDGLNEAGLSCASLTIDGKGAQYASGPSGNSDLDLDAPYFCRWVLESFAGVEEAAEGIAPMTVFTRSKSSGMSEHFYVSDEEGHGLVVEWVGGKIQLTRDFNDDGKTGYGILTNAPWFGWQVENIRHYHWKINTNREGRAIAIPGGFYPDDRFLRIHILRSAIEAEAQPSTLREAVNYAVSVLNSIQVPPGAPPAIDAWGDHTKWGVVRDHKNRRLYFRALDSPSLQLIDLQKLDLGKGAPITALSTELPAEIPWFKDVSSQFVAQSPSEKRAPLFT